MVVGSGACQPAVRGLSRGRREGAREREREREGERERERESCLLKTAWNRVSELKSVKMISIIIYFLWLLFGSCKHTVSCSGLLKGKDG